MVEDRQHIPSPSAWPPPPGTAAAQALLRAAREADPIGHRIHVLLAALYLATLPLATSGKDIGFALLAVCAIVRLPRTWRCYTPLFREPLLWVVLVWCAWQGIAIAWSGDPNEGFKSLRAFRVLATPWLLWPILDAIVLLIVAFLTGVVAANLVQVFQWLEWFGLRAAMNDRLRGLIHPIQLGMMCVTAMCFHLMLLLRLPFPGAGKWRKTLTIVALSVIGFCGAALGLVFSGSRGPWIAAAIAIPLLVTVTFIRRSTLRRRAGIVLIAGLMLAAAGWLAGRDMIGQRLSDAREEYDRAVEEGIVWTSTGLRLQLWEWAIDMWRSSPVVGIGAGEFETAERAHPEYADVVSHPRFRELVDEGSLPDDHLDRHHAHSTWLHVLACTGAIGLVLLTAVAVMALVRAWKDREDHLYTDAAFFALIAWLIGAQFDAFHLNGHMFGLFAFLIAIVLKHRAPCELNLPWLTGKRPQEEYDS